MMAGKLDTAALATANLSALMAPATPQARSECPR